MVSKPENNKLLSYAVTIIRRHIIYQFLNYTARSEVKQNLLSAKDNKTNEALYNRLAGLSNQEFAYLIRMAICSKSESKFTSQEAGYFLYQLAISAGIKVDVIKKEQEAKKKDRKQKMQVKLKELKKQADKLKAK